MAESYLKNDDFWGHSSNSFKTDIMLKFHSPNPLQFYSCSTWHARNNYKGLINTEDIYFFLEFLSREAQFALLASLH